MFTRNIYILIILPLLAFIFMIWVQLSNDTIKHTFVFNNQQKKYDIRQLTVAGDFNDFDPGIHYLHDDDGDNIWRLQMPLQRGRHSYRFVLNNTRWLRDPANPNYDGPYSNACIFVDTVRYPEYSGISPPNGRWLNAPADSMHIRFDRPLDTGRYDMRFEIDGRPLALAGSDASLTAPFPLLEEGRRHWVLSLFTAQGEPVYEKKGLWGINYENQAPVAEAGYAQFTNLDQPLMLNGGQSRDPDFENIAEYQWRLLNGSRSARLENTKSPFPVFIASEEGRYILSLTVSDSAGLSSTDRTEVIVHPQRQIRHQFTFDPALYADAVKSVALVGEFNQWQNGVHNLVYDEAGGIWEISIPLPKGQYEYKYVVNGDQWIKDPGNPHSIEDGWQGYNSIRIIPPPIEAGLDFGLERISETDLRIEVPVVVRGADHQSINLYADINNPDRRLEWTGKSIRFSKFRSQGSYYFYAVLKADDRFSRPKVLLINHYDRTTVHDFGASPSWADTSVIYEIFVRRFTRAGDFQGVIDNLQYLKTLGVNVLWLMPVYEGPTGHGYAPTDLFHVEKDYGSLEEYKRLIDAAHRAGMKVIFDFVANHLSDQHHFVYAAADNVHSPLRRWFHWQSDGMWDYHNDWDTLVNLNFNNPQVRHYIMESARFWLSLGIDGFRCDVAWAVPHSFWKNFRREIKKLNPQCLLINEVLPRQPAYHDFEFDMSYDTDFYGNVLDVMENKKPLSALANGLKKTNYNYPVSAKDLRYLENHDLPRFIKTYGPERTRLMAVLLFTISGTPLIYYGQENGLMEMRPDYAPQKNSEWFDFYQSLLILRSRKQALTFGKMKTVELDDKRQVWHFRRIYKQNVIGVFINLSKEMRYINLPENTTTLLGETKSKRNADGQLQLNPQGFLVYEWTGK